MKFSLNWLSEFVELPNDVGQLADLLTLAGVEIEAIEERGANFENVVVAQIKSSERHPNADRLSVCQVDDGAAKSTRSSAERRTTRWATRCRWRILARSCLTD
jgi:phenylalanyl-tRNA synthetase beta chain